MDKIRFFLYFALAFVGLLLYQAWQRDYGNQNPSGQQVPANPNASSVLSPANTVDPSNTATSAIPNTVPTTSIPKLATQPTISMPVVTVETDILRAELSTQGGTLQSLQLLDYPVAPETPDLKLHLLKPQDPNFYVAQSGLVGNQQNPAPSHQAKFTVPKLNYKLNPTQDSISVDLTWSHASGTKVIKRFIFQRNSYLIELQQIVQNNTAKPLVVRPYVQLLRSKPIKSKDDSYSSTFSGAAYYNLQDKYNKLSFDKIAKTPHKSESSGGWIAMVQHYFVAAWIPDQTSKVTIYAKGFSGTRYAIGMYPDSMAIQPGSTHTFSEKLFAGPKLQNTLGSIAPGLELTVDYGWLTVFAQPIFWLLNKLYLIFQNWGWAIIFLTILIKLAFYKLSEASYKSMANMRELAPKLQALKDRYGDDKERLNKAMMELYKEEKINPLGGCLPILVQIPVFIALYWVLLESVEMRQAPFALWITNLSAADPYFILPLIMGVSMFLQQQLSPAPVDPMQAKAMMLMPFIFTVFFAFFPSGLVLYWVVNNVLSIAQQWYITRAVEGVKSKPQTNK